MDAIRAAIADLLPVLEPAASITPGTDEVVIPVPDGRARVSLDSLISACSGADDHAWPRIIEQWFGDLRQRLDAPAPPSLTADDLRTRLVPSTQDEPPVTGLVALPYGAHFVLQVVADRPGAVEWVTEEQVRALGLDSNEALSAGLRNTVHKVLLPLDIRVHELAPGVPVSVGAADGVPYVSTALTSIPNVFRTAELPHGALVAAPKLSAVLFHEVRSDQALSVAVVMGRLVADMHADAVDPCSPLLWWWHDRRIYPVSISDGHRVELDPALEPVVAGLPPFED